MRILHWIAMLAVGLAVAAHRIEMNSNAYAAIRAIVSTLATAYPKLTFTLFVSHCLRLDLRFVRRYANVNLWQSYPPHFELPPGHKQLIVSCDTENSAGWRMGTWYPVSLCGYWNTCSVDFLERDRFYTNDRIIVQVREMFNNELVFNPPWRLGPRIDEIIRYKSYILLFRCVIIIMVREKTERIILARMILPKAHVPLMMATDLHIIPADTRALKTIFETPKRKQNYTPVIRFTGVGAVMDEGGFEIFFGQCGNVSTQYVYGHSFSAVRLALPLRWSSRLVSSLANHIDFELPLFVVSALVLPLVLALRRHAIATRAFWVAVLQTGLHILTGESTSSSLLTSPRQGVLVLAIGAATIMLLQLPVNVIKGEVVSSTQDDRIQHSTCSINACQLTAYRGPWFFRKQHSKPRGIIDSLADLNVTRRPQADVTYENWRRPCDPTAILPVGSYRETKLAILIRYRAICDMPDLLRYHLNDFSRTNWSLLFEHFRVNHNTEAICSCGIRRTSVVDYWKHTAVTRRLLEHGIMAYLHLNASLHAKDEYETEYWTRDDHGFREWGQSSRVVPVLNAVERNLKRGYAKYNMYTDRSETNVIAFVQVYPVVRLYAGGVTFAAICVVFELILRAAASDKWRRTSSATSSRPEQESRAYASDYTSVWSSGDTLRFAPEHNNGQTRPTAYFLDGSNRTTRLNRLAR